jgi:hypothetical protein
MNTKTPAEYLVESGLTGADLEFALARVADFDVDLVRAQIADYDDPAVAARRAKRSGPGVERAAKMIAAKRAWLAAQ